MNYQQLIEEAHRVYNEAMRSCEEITASAAKTGYFLKPVVLKSDVNQGWQPRQGVFDDWKPL
jgi:hypothetical protein